MTIEIFLKDDGYVVFQNVHDYYIREGVICITKDFVENTSYNQVVIPLTDITHMEVKVVFVPLFPETEV